MKICYFFTVDQLIAVKIKKIAQSKTKINNKIHSILQYI